ncbi:MAG: DUF6635 family protein [Oceanococcus sp.]
MRSDPIALFCQRHYAWRSAWRLNQRAIGWDLWRAGFNVMFAPVWLLAQIGAGLLKAAGLQRGAKVLLKIPIGLRTNLHRSLELALLTELVSLPSDASANHRITIDRAIQHYLATRAATAEIAASLVALLIGGLLFDALTPGGIGLGLEIAEAMNWQLAISHFWAGEWLGQLWFGWFPPQTATWLITLCVLGAFIALAVLASLSGCITDPLQTSLGLHQRRLRRWQTRLQQALDDQTEAKNRSPEPLMARVFDAMDWLRF